MVSPWKLTLDFFGLLFIYASEQKNMMLICFPLLNHQHISYWTFKISSVKSINIEM